MLIRHRDARDSRIDRKRAFMLAAVAGGFNAAALNAVAFFSSMMTGDASTLSSLQALEKWIHESGHALVLLTSIAEALVLTFAIAAGLRRGIVKNHARLDLTEALFFALPGPALLGRQNAIVTNISDARVRTTRVSGMSADIGIGLARVIDIPRGKAPRTFHSVITKLHLHGSTVASFPMGDVAGVLLWKGKRRCQFFGCCATSYGDGASFTRRS